MNKRIDIHDFNSRLASAKKLLKLANPISKKNSAIISKFENYGISEGPSKARVTKYVYTLRKIAEMLDKNFDVLTTIDSGTNKPTRIMYETNLSWTIACNVFDSLIKGDFISADKKKRSRRYYITKKGRNALSYHLKSLEGLTVFSEN